MGRWGDGEMGRWGDGEMGGWGDGERKIYKAFVVSAILLPSCFQFAIPNYPLPIRNSQLPIPNPKSKIQNPKFFDL